MTLLTTELMAQTKAATRAQTVKDLTTETKATEGAYGIDGCKASARFESARRLG